MRLSSSHVVSGVLAVALLGATGAAWYFAAQARTPAQRAEATAEPADSVVTVPVEQGRLVDTVSLSAELDRTGGFAVGAPSAPAGAEVALASGVPLEAGDEVGAGTVLLEVSGRPMIALPGDVPAYRDLAEGDSGPDVEQLQRALSWFYGTPVTGEFGARTADDVERLYENLGYEADTVAAAVEPDPAEGEVPPEGGGARTGTVERVRLPASEAVFLPELPMQVGEVGAEQSAPVEGTVMTLVSGDWKLEAELSEAEAAELAKFGEDAELEYGSGPFDGLEAAAPELERREVEPEQADPWAAESAEPVERTVAVFELSESDLDDAGELVPGTEQEVVLVRARSEEGALIVPLSALWTDAAGATLVTVQAGEGEAERHVEVEVTVRHEGRGAVEPVGGELEGGDRVVVAWRDRDGR
ncbi:peptidoglycan-binding domain-containing protein [Glycomyces xiaoerkulensis]|uniref:peptidoglycan-binding domain-containing protein n=1 Tax=Glycomyces xiaoerkulensis TaxID=2038139 RepID=UPI0012FFDF15|nr:peptidoglycan-binding domain-containing protein [Glycomyces xiaoerkulensis]